MHFESVRWLSIELKPCCTTRWRRRRRRIISRIWFGNWCCCIAACHHRHFISTFIYIRLCWCDCFRPMQLRLCSCFISSPKLMFHFDLCCHLCRCKSYFVWHEWDIFCLIKFKLFAVRIGLVWCTCTLGVYLYMCVMQFQCSWYELMCVCVFFKSSNALHRFCCLGLFMHLWTLFGKCAFVEIATQNVWCQCKHSIVINYTDKIISETFCPAVFFSSFFVAVSMFERQRKRHDLSHYYSLSNLIELLWYITFRFA